MDCNLPGSSVHGDSPGKKQLFVCTFIYLINLQWLDSWIVLFFIIINNLVNTLPGSGRSSGLHSSILAWRIPWQWGLVGYSPWGCKESDTTERLSPHTEHKYIYIHTYIYILYVYIVACHAPLSIRFSRQEFWSGLSCIPAEYLPDPGIEPSLPHCRQILYRLSHKGSPYIHIF